MAELIVTLKIFTRLLDRDLGVFVIALIRVVTANRFRKLLRRSMSPYNVWEWSLVLTSLPYALNAHKRWTFFACFSYLSVQSKIMLRGVLGQLNDSLKVHSGATRMLRETHQHLDIFSYYGKFHLSLIETGQVCLPMHSFHSRLMGRNALRGNFSVKLPNFALEWHWLTFKYGTFLKSLGAMDGVGDFLYNFGNLR